MGTGAAVQRVARAGDLSAGGLRALVGGASAPMLLSQIAATRKESTGAEAPPTRARGPAAGPRPRRAVTRRRP
ncbi:DUF6053 domain-containing protein [Lysobacter enzymogenes]|uniref:DUF6053 domain-containing protein n=1 Tax=Lysobacter enzymogenes TaxID=69 RepID=UPI003749A1E9